MSEYTERMIDAAMDEIIPGMAVDRHDMRKAIVAALRAAGYEILAREMEDEAK